MPTALILNSQRVFKRVKISTVTAAVLATLPVLAWAQINTATPIATAETKKSTTQQLETVEIVGRQQSGAYHAIDATGTKTELTLRELPQAVRVMTRQTIDDLGAVRLDDLLEYAGGVSRQNQFGGLWDNIAIRGFAGDINNGMPLLTNGLNSNRGFNAPRDMANVERVEFLKGPVANLYGASEPGGTINIVTKKPKFQSGHAAELYAGTQQFGRLAVDSTGPLGETIAYRLNVAVEDKGSFRDFMSAKRTVAAPALLWRINSYATLDYDGQWLRQQAPLDRGIPAVAGQLGAVPRERFLGEPADGNVTLKNNTQQWVFKHRLPMEWAAQLSVATKRNSLYGFSTEAAAALQADDRTLRRQRRFRDYTSDDISYTAEVRGAWQLSNLRNEFLGGVERYKFTIDSLMLRVNPSAAAPYAVDVFNPVYGQAQPTLLPNTSTFETQKIRLGLCRTQLQ